MRSEKVLKGDLTDDLKKKNPYGRNLSLSIHSKISIARVQIPAVKISVQIYNSVLEESGRQCKVKCDSGSSEANYVFDAWGLKV